ncbi:MAG: PhzF family phenazine biosynthesis protein [Phycisphaeraceae bacterium]|nr:PhzF family phenazine biosynthesis protein [Phycisphaerales bacterium]MCB9859711.1 PhzF family phenazine biosynthesis protein [Phycisphaeraceae bacterium]
MPIIRTFHVDAFTSTLFAGNPAVVCVLDAWLDDALLQSVAMENNAPITAFLVFGDNSWDIRWFTCTTEIALCGHGTLAAASVILSRIARESRDVVFSSNSGILRVRAQDNLYILDFPATFAQRIDAMPEIETAIKADVLALYDAGKLIAFLRDEQAVRNVAPDLDTIAATCPEGLVITAAGAQCDFVSRYFAPHAGINEDQVTGSAHCILGPMWSERLGKQRMTAQQLSQRGGELVVEVNGGRVLLGASAVLYAEGVIHLPLSSKANPADTQQ